MNLLMPLALGIVLPASVTASISLLAVGAGRKNLRGMAGFLTATAVAAGYLTAQTGLAGWPPFPPAEATQWIAVLALGALAISALEIWRPERVVTLSLARAIAVCAVTGLVLDGMIRYTWSPMVSTVWVLGCASLALGLWIGMNREFKRSDPHLFLLLMILTAGATSIMMILSGSALLSQLSGALAAVLGVFAVISWRTRVSWLPQALMPLFISIMTGIWLSGYHYATLSGLSLGLLLTSVVLALSLRRVPWFRRLSPLGAVLVFMLGQGVPLLLAIGIGLQSFFASGQPNIP